MECNKIINDAQKRGVGFYKFGFILTSNDLLEEGVVDQVIELDL